MNYHHKNQFTCNNLNHKNINQNLHFQLEHGSYSSLGSYYISY